MEVEHQPTLAVVGPSGRRLKSLVVETSAQALVEAVRSIGEQRRLCMEEGTQSEWLYEVLSRHVDELVVAGVVSTICGASLASSAICCSFVETLAGLNVPGIFPSSSSINRLPSFLRGVRLGGVPPLLRSY